MVRYCIALHCRPGSGPGAVVKAACLESRGLEIEHQVSKTQNISKLGDENVLGIAR